MYLLQQLFQRFDWHNSRYQRLDIDDGLQMVLFSSNATMQNHIILIISSDLDSENENIKSSLMENPVIKIEYPPLHSEQSSALKILFIW